MLPKQLLQFLQFHNFKFIAYILLHQHKEWKIFFPHILIEHYFLYLKSASTIFTTYWLLEYFLKKKDFHLLTAVSFRLVFDYEYTISFNTILSTQAWMLFINLIHLIISSDFSFSVTSCFVAIFFIRYSYTWHTEVSIWIKCSFNFPLPSRVKYNAFLCSLKYDRYTVSIPNCFTYIWFTTDKSVGCMGSVG